MVIALFCLLSFLCTNSQIHQICTNLLHMVKNSRLLVQLFFLAEILFGGFLLLPIWTPQAYHIVSLLGQL